MDEEKIKEAWKDFQENMPTGPVTAEVIFRAGYEAGVKAAS